MRKKGIAILLTIVLLCTVAACSSDNSGNSNPSSTSAATNEPSASSPASETPAEPVKAYILTKVEAGSELPDDKLILDYIKAETNVEPIMIKPPAGTYQEKLNIMLAADEPLDAFIVDDWTEYQKKGMLMPLNEFLDKSPELKANYTDDAWRIMTDSKTGNIYGIPFSSGSTGNVLRIRQDWLDTLGLQLPTTLEEFEAVLEAFKTTDKFGKNVIPLITHLSVEQMDRAFAGLWLEQGNRDWVDGEGNVRPAVLHPKYKDYIAKMAEWYAKGYIWKEAFSQEYTVVNDLVAQDRVGVLATWVSVGITGIETLKTKDPNISYTYMKQFNGPAGSAYSQLLPTRQGIAFSAKSKNADATIKFFNWGVSNTTVSNNLYFGMEGTHWDWVDQDKGLIARAPEAEKKYSGIYSLVQGSNSQIEDKSISGQLWYDYFQLSNDPVKSGLNLKLPGDYGSVYDESKIIATVPSVGDIDKFRDSWLAKFITGQEPMSRWDHFIEELNKIGLAKMVEERSNQYKAQQ